jgi:hypothetical protein
MEILPFSGSISPDALAGSTLDTFQWNGDSIIAVSESAVGIITVEGEGSASNLKAYYRLLDGFVEPAIDSAFIITTAAVASSVDHGTLYTAYSEKLQVHAIQGAGAESSLSSIQKFNFSDIDCGLVSGGNATVGPPYGIPSLFVTRASLFLALTSCASQSGVRFPLNTDGSVQFGLAECAFYESSDPSKQCLEPAKGQGAAAMTAAFLYSIDPASQQVVKRCKPDDLYEDVTITNVAGQRHIPPRQTLDKRQDKGEDKTRQRRRQDKTITPAALLLVFLSRTVSYHRALCNNPCLCGALSCLVCLCLCLCLGSGSWSWF